MHASVDRRDTTQSVVGHRDDHQDFSGQHRDPLHPRVAVLLAGTHGQQTGAILPSARSYLNGKISVVWAIHCATFRHTYARGLSQAAEEPKSGGAMMERTRTIARRAAVRALGADHRDGGAGRGRARRRCANRRGQDRPRGRAEHVRPAPDRRPQHPDLHRQRLRRTDRPRRPGQSGAGPRGVVEAAEPHHLAVRPAQGCQVPQRRRLQRRIGQVHPRPGDQPGDQGHHRLRAQHDRRHRDRGPLHGERRSPRRPTSCCRSAWASYSA